MADTVQTKWIYPPSWTGHPPDHGGWKRICIQLTANFTVGTEGETRQRKIDVSELRTPAGEEATSLVLEQVDYNVSGLQNVLLEWDVRPYEKALVLSGAGSVNFGRMGGAKSVGGGGGTGDLLLTTTGAADGASYDITIIARPKG